MNVRTDRETDEIHKYHVYVGLAQARPNEVDPSIATLSPAVIRCHEFMQAFN